VLSDQDHVKNRWNKYFGGELYNQQIDIYRTVFCVSRLLKDKVEVAIAID